MLRIRIGRPFARLYKALQSRFDTGPSDTAIEPASYLVTKLLELAILPPRIHATTLDKRTKSMIQSAYTVTRKPSATYSGWRTRAVLGRWGINDRSRAQTSNGEAQLMNSLCAIESYFFGMTGLVRLLIVCSRKYSQLRGSGESLDESTCFTSTRFSRHLEGMPRMTTE